MRAFLEALPQACVDYSLAICAICIAAILVRVTAYAFFVI